jgi:D-alanyl-D-alanine carboxypeptidase
MVKYMKMNDVFFILIVGLSVVFLFFCFNCRQMKSIYSFLRQQVDQHQTPSIQYAFFDTDSVVYEMRYGMSDIKARKPIEEETTYNLFSVTKTITALAVLQLAQEGRVDLNKPVISYLPDFPYEREITIEQLLNHTSGIPNPLPLKWIHLAEEHQQFDRDSFFEDIFRSNPKLDFPHGTKFKYSNLGYVFLGQIVEKVSGQSFEKYVRENITERCGISSSDLGFQIQPSTHAIGYHKYWSASNAAFGFLLDKSKYMGPKEGRWKPFNYFYTNGIAYGGMVGSARGLVKYAQTLLKADSPLLNDQYKSMLFTECAVQNKPTGMSFSWFTGALKGHRYFSHAGGGGGYYVELRVYPDLGVGSVIMYNRSGMSDERMLDKTDSFFITEGRNNQAVTLN